MLVKTHRFLRLRYISAVAGVCVAAVCLALLASSYIMSARKGDSSWKYIEPKSKVVPNVLVVLKGDDTLNVSLRLSAAEWPSMSIRLSTLEYRLLNEGVNHGGIEAGERLDESILASWIAKEKPDLDTGDVRVRTEISELMSLIRDIAQTKDVALSASKLKSYNVLSITAK